MSEVKKATTETFADEIINSKKPTIVYFWADWCNPCKQMGPLYEENAKVQNSVEMFKLDVDANQQIAQQYNIMSIPTFLLFKDGQVVAQNVGSMALDQLKKFAEQ